MIPRLFASAAVLALFAGAAQVQETLDKHFGDEGDLILLACDADGMDADLRWEKSRGGQDFPHLYRALRMADVTWSRPLPKGQDGHRAGVAE